jgi:hypothetical protein
LTLGSPELGNAGLKKGLFRLHIFNVFRALRVRKTRLLAQPPLSDLGLRDLGAMCFCLLHRENLLPRLLIRRPLHRKELIGRRQHFLLVPSDRVLAGDRQRWHAR